MSELNPRWLPRWPPRSIIYTWIQLCRHIYFATNLVELSALKQKLWQFINFGCGHLGGHLGFSYVDTQEVIVFYLDELRIYENIYFDTNFVNLSVLKQK